ncbi:MULTISPECIES: entericidin [unclassified Ensifer]|uniref:entericidin n=1 Tax=unclassified Ensifer TaxID=2633371 RepID=UPI0008133AE3|nr:MULTISPECIES: entericidin [unclassified Ensifer]OCP04478.1 entericidin [Ensifer sp. LC11]OCP04756.1 entericidin [Ensifer sp. LC13]OCP13337.1 entericidin [Ensifer sp. LC14]OCP30580.1 entericidin [Ensifer sp. LC499]
MSKAMLSVLFLALLVLSACGNTARGFRQDSTETGHALDDATHRVLKSTSK